MKGVTEAELAQEHALVQAVRQAGLTGRGGAGFSTAIKIQALFDYDADLIVNACDGELGAAKDAWVVQHHLGEIRAAVDLLANGGRRLVWYAAHRDSATAQLLAKAGLPLLEVPNRYVSSEEHSLINMVGGGPAKPLELRQPTAYGGRDSRGRVVEPTVVFNAETLWHIAQIMNYGPEWFAAFGTADEPGPRLVALSGYVRAPVVCQSAAGASLAQLLAHAGGLAPEVQAVMIGGFGGGFLTAHQARQAVWSRQWLTPLGVSIGSGVIEVLDPHVCPLVFMGQLIDYAAGQSAGQCGPCMFGLPALSDDWYALVMQPGSATQYQQRFGAIQRRLQLLLGRGACHFPDGVSRWVRSGLHVFAEHISAHQQGFCPTASVEGSTGAVQPPPRQPVRPVADEQMWR